MELNNIKIQIFHARVDPNSKPVTGTWLTGNTNIFGSLLSRFLKTLFLWYSSLESTTPRSGYNKVHLWKWCDCSIEEERDLGRGKNLTSDQKQTVDLSVWIFCDHNSLSLKCWRWEGPIGTTTDLTEFNCSATVQINTSVFEFKITVQDF